MSKNKKITLIIILIFVLILGGFLFYSQTNSNTPNSSPNKSTNTNQLFPVSAFQKVVQNISNVINSTSTNSIFGDEDKVRNF